MSSILRAAIAAFALVLLALSPAAAEKSLQREDLASAATRLEAKFKKTAKPAGTSLDKARKDGDAALAAGDYDKALEAFSAAIVLDPKDWSVWNRYAIAAARVVRSSYSDRYQIRADAAAAAYAAYQRSAAKPDEAAALATLGLAETAQENWRYAINAYAESLKLVEAANVRAQHTALRDKYGFRFETASVDNNAAQPRACFEFTEELKRNTDYSPYVAVTGMANPAVTASGRQICIDGLEHGKRYGIVIRAGLPSAIAGEDLLKTIDYTTYVKDRAPQVRFTGRNYVLPRTGQEGLPVVTVNTKSVEIEIFRIGDRSIVPTLRDENFLKALDKYQTDKIADEKGLRVWKGSLDVPMDINKDVVTAFPVLEAVGKLEAGIYVMSAVAAGAKVEEYDNRATQWFLVSDLGLTAMTGSSGATVMVRSLASAEPLAGVEVKLVAKNNEVLGTAKTDAKGLASFAPGLARGAGGTAPGLVVATDAKGDYGFLDLTGQAFDLTDRGVGGRDAPTGLDAFLFTERGVYRSGETVYLTALLRDTKGTAAAGVPLTIVAKRPDGVEYRRQVVEDQGEGGRSLSLTLNSGLPTGTWRLEAYADPKRPPIGEVTFLVEDYVAERIELKLAPAAERLRAGEPARIAVEARQLYGAAGADLEVSGEISVDLAKKTTVPGLEGWVIGLDDESFEAVTQDLQETATTDENGKADVTVPMPRYKTSRPVEAKVTLRVNESGGRAVTRSVTLPILPEGNVLAVRKRFEDSALNEGSVAEFELAYASPDGERRARKGVAWELSRVHKRYQWYNSEGRWDYETVTSTSRVSNGRTDIAAAEPARLAVPVDWGSYRLDLTDDTGAHTSVSFSVGWGGSDKPDTPDVLDVKLDKSAYRAGDEMKVRVTPRFDGKATIAIVSDGVVDTHVVDAVKAGTTVSVPVKAEWGAGAYVVGFAHRPLDVAAHRMPGRAIGVSWFGIDQDQRTIGVSLGTQALQRPRGPLTIPVKLAGLAPGETANVVVSAVDLGILNLTRYETPNPEKFYFGQRQLGVELRDLYGYLIDGMQGVRGTIRSGGDSVAESGADVPRDLPLARYSGVVKVGADGTATVTFDLPAFNGTVRVAAIAWSKGRVGHAQADVVVRDPVVVQATLPRFLTLGDRSRFHMAIDNVEAPAGDYTVDVDIHGPVVIPADSLRSTIALKKNGRSELTIPVTAAGVGAAVIDVKFSGQGLDLNQQLVLRVQPGVPAVYRRTVQPLAANGGSVTIGPDLVSDFVAGTGVVSLSVAPVGAFDVPALLKALDRYPYGCSEQLVSRAMPLLYVNRLAREEQLALDEKIDQRIRDTVDKVLARQDSSGTFGLWSVGGENVWLDAFVTDFLTRARERGFEVPKVAFELALDHLRNVIANMEDPSAENAPEIAYAAYVLARNGRPVIGDLRYLADQKLDMFQTPLSRAQLGAALAMLGDRGRAQPIFLSAMDRLVAIKAERNYRHDYGSALRDGAGIMAMMAESGFGQPTFQRASLVVEEVRTRQTYTSTQENAWMVIAAHAMLKDAERLTLSVNGAAHQGALYRSFRGLALTDGPVTVANTSSAPAQLVVTASGHPIQPEPALSNGYTIERTYYKLDGTKADPSKVRQTDRLVVVLKVTEASAQAADLLLVDHLPAGFEIDNPKLVDGSDTDKFSWLESSVEPSHTEYRDDRFVAAFDRTASQSAFFHVAYIVRAVAPGTYMHPPAVVEDMYRPERFGRTGFGTVEVQPKR
ncbi:MG2 domain-containing protein [Prosthecomicrobium hirschii]|uniref:alpha-2-macroglobulin family protein n=1 Tax=Prosthecodimorpha hirschii TaxID=665126 RepID=UPI00221EA6C2|nr:MG2 domain-containing protein [Prosthecomicrobium hirschii]MCW1840345.1 MG2 domain-containing protein [Prosthecomicrobium hirschii]